MALTDLYLCFAKKRMMETEIKPCHKEKIRDGKIVVLDLDDTIIKGNVSYGAFYTVWDRLKKGKVSDALKMGVHGLRIYVESHLRRGSCEWDKKNYILEELGGVLSKYGVSGDEMEECAGKYMKLFRIAGAKDAVRKLKNYGEKKRMILLTREPDVCARAAKRHFGFDSYISNTAKLNGGKIKGIDIDIKKPEDDLNLLKKEIEGNGLELEDAVVISDNPEAHDVFKGKVGLFITYKNGNGDLNIDNYENFEKSLIGPD
jgi:phosphoserine phosphatase